MINNILPSSSGSRFKFKTVTDGIHLIEQGITKPEWSFLRHLACVSTQNPCSSHQESPKMTSRFPISNTSASNVNLLKRDPSEKTLNVVFTTYFPPARVDPSPCRTLTFLALFQHPNFFAILSPITGALAPVSNTALTSSLAIVIWTVKRGVCLGVCPTVGDTLRIRFPIPLILTRWSSGVFDQCIASCCWQVVGWRSVVSRGGVSWPATQFCSLLRSVPSFYISDIVLLAFFSLQLGRGLVGLFR